jgi:hypothetical protein
VSKTKPTPYLMAFQSANSSENQVTKHSRTLLTLPSENQQYTSQRVYLIISNRSVKMPSQKKVVVINDHSILPEYDKIPKSFDNNNDILS